MSDNVTNSVADYIDKLGIKVSALSRETGIPDGILRRSLSARERSLRVDEFLEICDFLGKEPFDFSSKRARN